MSEVIAGIRRMQSQKASDLEYWDSRQNLMPRAQIMNLGHSRLGGMAK